MPKFIVERDIAGAGKLSERELQAVSQKSCRVINQMGSQIEWVQSYVTDDKVYCEYNAANKELVLEHARIAGFRADRISQVRSVFGPIDQE